MKSEIVEILWCAFEWCILNTQKVRSSNKFKKMKSLCKRWVLVRNPDTSREIVRFVHEVHPVFVVALSTFQHMLCGWNDDSIQLSSRASFRRFARCALFELHTFCVQNAPFKGTPQNFNNFWLHLVFFVHLLIFFELVDPEIEKHYKWTLKMLKVGMLSSFHPHSMC